MLDRLAADSGSGLGNFEVSPAGIYAGVTGTSSIGTARSLVWMDTGGKIQPLSLDAKDYNNPVISPDGKRLAVTVRAGGKSDIFLCDLTGERLTALTFTGQAFGSVWAPDGKHLVFATPERTSTYWVRADGSGAPEMLFAASDPMLILSTLGARRALWKIPLDLADPDHPKAGKAEPLPESGEALGAFFSPDGRWLAYVARGGPGAKAQVFVQPFPPTGGKWRISAGAGKVAWSRTSRELVFTDDNRIMVAAYRVEGRTFVAETPRPWSTQVNQGLASPCRTIPPSASCTTWVRTTW